MPKEVYSAIQQSKAFKKLGSMYNADINYMEVKSTKHNTLIHPALMLDKITPANIYTRIKHLFKPIPEYDFLYFITNGSKKEDLVSKINNISTNRLLNDFQEFLNR